MSESIFSFFLANTTLVTNITCLLPDAKIEDIDSSLQLVMLLSNGSYGTHGCALHYVRI